MENFIKFDLESKGSLVIITLKDQGKKAQETEVAFENIVVSEETKEEIKKAKLDGHGIIAKDKEGKLVQILSGHSYDEKAVKAIVTKLLAE